jgi:hypothetical protein
MPEIQDDVNRIMNMLEEIYHPEVAEAYMVIIRDEILEKEMNDEDPAQVLTDWQARLDFILREAKKDQSLVRCPCCRYYTLEERGGYEVCPGRAKCRPQFDPGENQLREHRGMPERSKRLRSKESREVLQETVRD